MLTYIILSLGAVSCVSAVLTVDLPYIAAMRRDEFNATKATGVWYQQKQYPLLHETNWKCTRDILRLNDAGDMIITNKGINMLTNTEESVTYLALKGLDVEKAFYSTNGIDKSIGDVNMEAQVVNTDYVCFWISYGFVQIGPVYFQGAWTATRQQYPDECCLNKLKKALKESGLNEELFIPTDQINCPAYDYNEY